MPIHTSKLPCHDAFGAAQLQRTKYPLTSGAYKLRQVRDAIARQQSTMNAIRDLHQSPASKRPGVLLGCCTTDDMEDWLKNLPQQVADMLSYDMLPAIAALAGDGISADDVAGELESANAHACNLLKDCAKQNKRLHDRVESELRSIKRGYSNLYALLVDADGIARRALELIDWCEARACFATSADVAGMRDWPAV